jgi:hypothetical protein
MLNPLSPRCADEHQRTVAFRSDFRAWYVRYRSHFTLDRVTGKARWHSSHERPLLSMAVRNSRPRQPRAVAAGARLHHEGSRLRAAAS